MNKKSLLILTSLLVFVLITACSVPVVPTQESTADSTGSRQMSVTGTGKVNVAPDIAYINIGVNSQSADVGEALDLNNQKSESVTKALIENGVAAQDIQTTSFNIWPQQQYNQMGEMTGTTYVVDNVVNVTVRDLSKLGQLLETSVQAGANSINSIQFDVSDRDSAVSEARDLAVQNAKAQAAELATLAGVELGEITNISVGGGGVPVPMYSGMGGGAGYAAEASVPVSAGQMVISSDVNITYALK
jgi:uncharacterized protein